MKITYVTWEFNLIITYITLFLYFLILIGEGIVIFVTNI